MRGSSYDFLERVAIDQTRRVHNVAHLGRDWDSIAAREQKR